MFEFEDLISVPYLNQLREKHTHKWGETGHRWADHVLLTVTSDIKSILDYGCGKGTLIAALRKKVLPELKFSEYDPGIMGKNNLPQPADMVICTDVMEHVEPDKTISVLCHIQSLAKKKAFFVICTGKAVHILPNGRNAHLNIKPAAWWAEIIRFVYPWLNLWSKKIERDTVMITVEK